MSVIFGIKQSEGNVVDEQELLDLAQATDRWAPDGLFVRAEGRIGIGFQPYRTHHRSNLESQPTADSLGNMVALDGRLDNHEELRELLEIGELETPDSQIVLAAFRRWGELCFARFIGDWALVLWAMRDQTLYLARDHAGARTLYYRYSRNCLMWSTYLETFFQSTLHHEFDLTYAAHYLCSQPILNRTPYSGIHAVPPSHYVSFRGSTETRQAHWRWIASQRLEYPKLTDYSEQFFSLFRTAVERRTGRGSPVLLQLSGGMDSSSIVSMSDWVRTGHGTGGGGIADTVSYYDDTEPSWNETPYFSAAEKLRGKVGLHIPARLADRRFLPIGGEAGKYLWPGSDGNTLRQEEMFEDLVRGSGYRSIVSGLGGDELLGGVPNPLPELADYLVKGRARKLQRKTLEWSLVKRTPLIHLAAATIGFAFHQYFPPGLSFPPWFTKKAIDLCSGSRACGSVYASWKYLPSELCNEEASSRILAGLPHTHPRSLERREWRYPYLDRDLVSYLLSVPREHLVRPGRRRYLMREALRGITPDLILDRPRKGFVVRGLVNSIAQNYESLRVLCEASRAVQLGLCDSRVVLLHLENAAQKRALQFLPDLQRLIAFELWAQAGNVPAHAES